MQNTSTARTLHKLEEFFLQDIADLLLRKGDDARLLVAIAARRRLHVLDLLPVHLRVVALEAVPQDEARRDRDCRHDRVGDECRLQTAQRGKTCLRQFLRRPAVSVATLRYARGRAASILLDSRI